MWHAPANYLRFIRRFHGVKYVFLFLPVGMILLVGKPFLFDHSDDSTCVVTATSSAHRVVGEMQSKLGRLGNDMFVYASLLGIAAKNKMVPVYESEALELTFQVKRTGNDVISSLVIDVYEKSVCR